MTRHFLVALVLTLFAFAISSAQTDGSNTTTRTVEEKLKQLEARILEMQRNHAAEMKQLADQIAALKQQLSKPKAVNKPTATAAIPQNHGSSQSTVGNTENAFNPKISVITDMVGVYGKRGDDSLDDMLVREVEIGFSGHVDTWGRYDLTTTIHNDVEFDLGDGLFSHDHDHAEEEAHGGGLEVEEAYFTFLTLPNGVQARVGKFRTSVGKSNQYHPHSLPWTEYPLAMRSYLGTEGLTGTGASLSWLLPIDHYTEITYEFYKANPIHAAAVAPEDVEDYSHLFNLRTFFDLTDSTTLELGATSLVAPHEMGIDGDDTWLNSVDITLKWQPFGDGTHRNFEWRTELFGLRKTLAMHDEDEHDHGEEEHADEEHAEELGRETMFGIYSSLAYRFDRWWEAGMRYDFVEGPYDLHQEESEYSLFLTWWQSEYAYWRLNVIRNELTLDDFEADSLYKVYLQFNFSMGPHPAHKY